MKVSGFFSRRSSQTKISGVFCIDFTALIGRGTAVILPIHAEDVGAAPAPAPAAAPSTPAAGGGMPLGKLHVLNGPIAGKELELTKALITLGKPGVQVAVISRRPQGYFLTHIEGDGQNNNYPIVNGAPIGAQAYTLKSGDVIELAGIKMEFSM